MYYNNCFAKRKQKATLRSARFHSFWVSSAELIYFSLGHSWIIFLCFPILHWPFFAFFMDVIFFLYFLLIYYFVTKLLGTTLNWRKRVPARFKPIGSHNIPAELPDASFVDPWIIYINLLTRQANGWFESIFHFITPQ